AAHPDRGRGADLVDPQAQVDDGIAGYAQVLQLQVEGDALPRGECPDLTRPVPVDGPPLRGGGVDGDLLRAFAAGVGEGHCRGAALAHTDHRGILRSLHGERGSGPVVQLALTTTDADGDRELVLVAPAVLTHRGAGDLDRLRLAGQLVHTHQLGPRRRCQDERDLLLRLPVLAVVVTHQLLRRGQLRIADQAVDD